jgi:hypothetical protein
MKQVRLFSTNYRSIIETEFKLVEWTIAKETKKSAIRKFTGFKNNIKYNGQVRLAFYGAEVVLYMEYKEFED